MTTEDYATRLREYRQMLENARKSLMDLSEEESILGAISADNQITIYDFVIEELDELFPELTGSQLERKLK